MLFETSHGGLRAQPNNQTHGDETVESSQKQQSQSHTGIPQERGGNRQILSYH